MENNIFWLESISIRKMILLEVESTWICLCWLLIVNQNYKMAYLIKSINLLLLSLNRMVSGSHWISQRSSFGHCEANADTIWSTWTRDCILRNHPLAVPNTQILNKQRNKEKKMTIYLFSIEEVIYIWLILVVRSNLHIMVCSIVSVSIVGIIYYSTSCNRKVVLTKP